MAQETSTSLSVTKTVTNSATNSVMQGEAPTAAVALLSRQTLAVHVGGMCHCHAPPQQRLSSTVIQPQYSAYKPCSTRGIEKSLKHPQGKLVGRCVLCQHAVWPPLQLSFADELKDSASLLHCLSSEQSGHLNTEPLQCTCTNPHLSLPLDAEVQRHLMHAVGQLMNANVDL